MLGNEPEILDFKFEDDPTFILSFIGAIKNIPESVFAAICIISLNNLRKIEI